MKSRHSSRQAVRGRPAAVLALTLAGTVLAALPHAMAGAPWLVWNASASVPAGFYRLASGAPARGDFVLVQLPEPLRRLAAARGYLPRAVPLIKRLAAMPGDIVCAGWAGIFVDGRRVATRLARDARGRPLPRWTGCVALAPDAAFVLGDAGPGSFDSRYFGPLPAASIIGRLVPLWTE